MCWGWGLGWAKASQTFSNTTSYLPCKSAFVNATFVSEKRKKNGKKRRQSIAAVSETAQLQRRRSPKRHEGKGGRGGGVRGYAWLISVQCKK